MVSSPAIGWEQRITHAVPSSLSGIVNCPRTGHAWRSRAGRGEGPFAELLAQPDDDVLGAADVGEPIRILVLHHVADQSGTVGEQVRDHAINVVNGEHDAADP